jgi:proteasome assembly chaperone (PAC2) family protein
MGTVAQIAGTHLARQLRAKPIAELDSREYFEPRSITVRGGLAGVPALPKSVLVAWRNQVADRDLVILVGDQQPALAASSYANAVLDLAAEYAVERVVTFAAMATPIHPAATPRVFGVATRTELLKELEKNGVTLLEDGEISGMNGTFIGAAAARGLPAVCLLGEFPFFAAQFPNPKASVAVLEVFSKLFGTAIDVESLRTEAARFEATLVGQLAELQDSAEHSSNGEPDGETTAGPEAAVEPQPLDAEKSPKVSKQVLERIESLFGQVQQDRAKALDLKAELDRHGLFKRYEDRFLDFFKKAG